MLVLRPNCEMCDRNLPPESYAARICSYECTFCAACVADVLRNVCPNCGGGFAPRPIRPKDAHRPGTGIAHHPAGKQRRQLRWQPDEIADLTARLRDVPAERR